MIVVTAPTGDIGHQVVESLLEHDTPVRVIVRDPSRLPDILHNKVDVVQGSHADADTVRRAFEGAEAVFWLVPAATKAESVMVAYVDFSRPAAAALKGNGVKRVVGITALGRTTPLADNAGYVTGSLAMDDLIASTGVDFRALTMPSFMDNLLMQAASIKNQGLFFSPISGDLKLPSCATRDITAVASRLLLDASWSGQEEVAILGPENISFNDMAEIISDVLGKPVRFQQISFEAYKARFLQFGFSEAMAQGMTDMADAKNQGLDLGVERTPENTTPTGFRQWCEDVLRPALLG
ncbi:NmrA family transcriptional regulator [Rhizobium ruizarguesonis]|uniref:NmrA family transcriptional regulator n=1 Tax=Rhizobium ruizarguesonis TaxID=2081791 RepID=A0ABY1X5F9_9HYPH|nr:NAD(P)H-binding protein [Rhizobium ruizarguesonis]TAU17158.1 NmrA family transcriptional regulator [Rhizobium ruizarguesonis]TAU57546.1 NmrA family transcriptional regulator [Rhizobium ruizarguesonis]TAU59366.1 NmrA family transcriptional regulator [Rhizobium ruizarguesonis]TAV03557.1 NmrA family transcriptional regulator [Rhizobium ruizarguesonis]TAV19701.1 NmrA family transcriptional regulator [Rhizobium ruizarguesonis]